MHDETDISLVHAHSEGVGSYDDSQLPSLEVVLNIRFGVGLKTGMKVLARPSLANQEIGQLLSTLATGNEDDCTALLSVQVLSQ